MELVLVSKVGLVPAAASHNAKATAMGMDSVLFLRPIAQASVSAMLVLQVVLVSMWRCTHSCALVPTTAQGKACAWMDFARATLVSGALIAARRNALLGCPVSTATNPLVRTIVKGRAFVWVALVSVRRPSWA